MRGHPGELGCDRLVFADRSAPLHALVHPLLSDLHHAPAAGGTTRRNRETPCIQCDEGELESLPFAPEEVFLRDEYVLEPDENVSDRAQTHELTAVRYLDSGRVHLQ